MFIYNGIYNIIYNVIYRINLYQFIPSYSIYYNLSVGIDSLICTLVVVSAPKSLCIYF